MPFKTREEKDLEEYEQHLLTQIPVRTEHEVCLRSIRPDDFKEAAFKILKATDLREAAFASAELVRAIDAFYMTQLHTLRSYYEKREDVAQLIEKVEYLLWRIEHDRRGKGQKADQRDTPAVQNP